MGAHPHHRYGQIYVLEDGKFRKVRRGEPAGPRYVKFNARLAARVRRFIGSHPRRWDQSTWTNDCGTAQCFAGHAAIMGGAMRLRTTVSPYSGLKMTEFRFLNGHAGFVKDVAEQLLGLNYEDCTELFMGANDLDRIDRLIAHFTDYPYSEAGHEDRYRSRPRYAANGAQAELMSEQI